MAEEREFKNVKLDVEFETAKEQEPLKSGELINESLAKIDRFMKDTQISSQEGNQITRKEDGWFAEGYDDTEIKKELSDIKSSTINGANVGDNEQFIKSAGSYVITASYAYDIQHRHYIEFASIDLTQPSLNTNTTSVSFMVADVGYIGSTTGSFIILVNLSCRQQRPNMRVEVLSRPSALTNIDENITYGYYVVDNVCHFCMVGPRSYPNETITITMLTRNDSISLKKYEFKDVKNYIIELPQGSEWVEAEIVDNRNELSDLKSYIGYTDPDIVGLHADFKNNVFTRLAGAKNLKPGEDFDKFNAFGGRRRCLVADNGDILAYRDDEYCRYVFTEVALNTIFPSRPQQDWISAEDAESGDISVSVLAMSGGSGSVSAIRCQVMVYQPKFWYKVTPLELEPVDGGEHGYILRNANYYVTDTPKPGFKLHPAFKIDGKERDYILLSAYEGCIYDVSAHEYLLCDEQVADFTAATGDKLSSIAGAKPCSGATQQLTRANARQLAHNRGEGWEQSYAASVAVSQLLMVIEYAAFDMQTAIGKGVVDKPRGTGNNSENTGGSRLLGNKSGSTVNANNQTIVSYRGEENFWGNLFFWIDGLIQFNGSSFTETDYARFYVADHAFSDDVAAPSYEHTGLYDHYGYTYTSAFGYSEEYDWMFIPAEGKGDSIRPIGDIQYTYWNNPNQAIVIAFGGNWISESGAGAFCYRANSNINGREADMNARLVYVPKPSEEVPA